MKRMSLKFLAASALLLVAVLPTSFGQIVLSENFNSYANGSTFVSGQPGWTAVSSFSGATTSVVTTAAESPFTNAVNGKGWGFSKPNSADGGGFYGATADFSALTTSAYIEFDYVYTAQGINNLNPIVRLSGNNASNVLTQAFDVRLAVSSVDPREFGFIGGTTENLQANAFDTWYRVTIDIPDVTTGLFTITRTPSGGSTSTWATGTFKNAVVDLRNIQISMGFNSATTTGALAVDNFIVAVPEPSTFALLAVGMVALVAIRRRKGCKQIA